MKIRSTKTPEKRSLVHELPGFVTQEEIDQIEAFEKKLNEFHSHVELSVTTFARERKERACNSYIANPNDKNFLAFRSAAIEEGLMHAQIMPGSVLSVVDGARETFIKAEIEPFVRPILERGLELARRNLDEVTSAESQRHEQLTDEPLSASGIVNAARRPVDELERHLKSIEQTSVYGSSVFPYLRSKLAAE